MLYRRLAEVELENAILRDTSTRSNSYNLRPTTAGTSGHFMQANKGAKLLSSIRIIRDGELTGTTINPIGAGRFGVCYTKYLATIKYV